MRRIILLVSLFWAGIADAQPDRYELGKKVRDLEVAWETRPPSGGGPLRAFVAHCEVALRHPCVRIEECTGAGRE